MNSGLPSLKCGGCVLCCQHTDIWLQRGETQRYDRTLETGHWRLRRLPNGDCVYLDRVSGCTIYDRRPQVCRDFDCRIAAHCRPKVRDRGLALLSEPERSQERPDGDPEG